MTEIQDLMQEYEPKRVTVDMLKESDYILKPLDYVEIESWEDLSIVGANLHKQARSEGPELEKELRIHHVSCRYESEDSSGKKDLTGSVITFLPVQIDIEKYNSLVQIIEDDLNNDFGVYAK